MPIKHIKIICYVTRLPSLSEIYPKEEALAVLHNMYYYTKNFEEIKEREFDYTYIHQFFHEKYLVDRLLIAKDIVGKWGDDGIDAYLDSISIKPNETVDMLKHSMRAIPIPEIHWESMSRIFSPEQFKHYLDIYNEFKQ